jgi:hypothetical protein
MDSFGAVAASAVSMSCCATPSTTVGTSGALGTVGTIGGLGTPLTGGDEAKSGISATRGTAADAGEAVGEAAPSGGRGAAYGVTLRVGTGGADGTHPPTGGWLTTTGLAGGGPVGGVGAAVSQGR